MSEKTFSAYLEILQEAERLLAELEEFLARYAGVDGRKSSSA